MRKGLLEWKILAAVFAILIVASSALVSNSGIKDIFMNSTGSVGDWMDNSPFGSLFSTPEKGSTEVTISLTAGRIGIEMETPVNVSTQESTLSNFEGPMTVDFSRNSSIFELAGTDFVLDTKLSETRIEHVTITKLILEDVDYVVDSEKTSVSGTDDKIEIYDFFGDIEINRSLTLEGNVSLVKDGKWSIS